MVEIAMEFLIKEALNLAPFDASIIDPKDYINHEDYHSVKDYMQNKNLVFSGNYSLLRNLAYLDSVNFE